MRQTKTLLGTLFFAWLACAGCGGPEDTTEDLGLETETETDSAALYGVEIELQPTRTCIAMNAATDPNAIRCRLPGTTWWRCEQGSTVTYKCTWWFQEP
jgi:hypothetical protein